jgi:hypothetical protein
MKLVEAHNVFISCTGKKYSFMFDGHSAEVNLKGDLKHE